MRLRTGGGLILGGAIALMLGSTITDGIEHLTTPESEGDIAEIVFLASITFIGGITGGAIASPLH